MWAGFSSESTSLLYVVCAVTGVNPYRIIGGASKEMPHQSLKTMLSTQRDGQ